MNEKNKSFSSGGGIFVVRYATVIVISCAAVFLVLEAIPAITVDRTGFSCGLGIFAASSLLTLISSKILLTGGSKRMGGMIATMKLLVTAVALFIALVVFKVDGISLVCGALVAVVLSSASFYVAVKSAA